jgi:hypothetical protein
VGVLAKCAAITAKGTQCKGLVRPGNDYCPAHDPARAEARRLSASKAGRASRATGDLHALKEKLIKLGDDVLVGKAPRGNASVAVAAYGTAIKAVEAEVKVRELQESRLIETQLKVTEQAELISRLEGLEERLEAEKTTSRGGGRWGA